MQDIAGCRVVVTGVVEQERVIASLVAVFPEVSVMDRREKPSYGYRAVHIIANIFGKPVEIQVRTALQHGWAEVSEKASDVIDPTIKYGGGPEFWRSCLSSSSEAVAAYEVAERAHENYERAYENLERTPAYENAERALEEFERAHEELEKADAELRKHHVSEQDEQEMQKTLVRSREELVRSREKMAHMREELVRSRRDMEQGKKKNVDFLSKLLSWLDEIQGEKQ